MNTTRQKIIRSATKLFAKKGLNGTSVREISRKASVNLAAINYHFQSKEQLYREIVSHHFQRLVENIAQLDQQKIDDEESYIERFVEHNLDLLFHGDRELECIVARELGTFSNQGHYLTQSFFQPALTSLTKRIQKGIAGKRFRKVDPRLAALSLISMCLFCANKQSLLATTLGVDTLSDRFRARMATHVTELFLRGIRK